MTDEHIGGAKQFLRHAGAGYQVAHQDEQRNHRKRVIAAGFIDLGLHHGKCRREIPIAQIGHAQKTDQAHRKGNRHAQKCQHQHQC